MTKRLGEIFPFRENIFEPLPAAVLVVSPFHKEKIVAGGPLTGLTKKEFLNLSSQIDKAHEYREKLLLLFNASGVLIIQTKLYLSEDKNIDLTPKENSSEPGIYNGLVREILTGADANEQEYRYYKNRFKTFDQYVSRLENRLNQPLSDRIALLASERKALGAEYPEQSRDQPKSYLDFDDNVESTNYSIGRIEIYNYLKGGGTIDYTTKFIDTRHHILILHCEELRKYEKYLSARGLKDVGTTPQASGLDKKINAGAEQDAARIGVATIALIYFYEGKQISRENAKEIASAYGWNSPNSGEGLFQDYIRYCNKDNRISHRETRKKSQNLLNLLESLAPYLSNRGLGRLKDEIKILQQKIETYFE